jgi:hypothetical protein
VLSFDSSPSRTLPHDGRLATRRPAIHGYASLDAFIRVAPEKLIHVHNLLLFLAWILIFFLMGASFGMNFRGCLTLRHRRPTTWRTHHLRIILSHNIIVSVLMKHIQLLNEVFCPFSTKTSTNYERYYQLKWTRRI